MPQPLKVAFLTRYSRNGASSRIRAMQFLPLLKEHGIAATLLPLHTHAYVDSLNMGRRDVGEVLKAYRQRIADAIHLDRFDVLWVEKELLPMAPFWMERCLLRSKPFVLDFDDAVFHNYDSSRNGLVRVLLGDKIDRLMRMATIVTVGNAYLGDRAARAGAKTIELLPSVIDLSNYPEPLSYDVEPEPNLDLRLVWVGSPSTQPYLELIRKPLEQLSQRLRLRLDVVGAVAPQFSGVECRSIPWVEGQDAARISAADVGIMPLLDSRWEQGKCSFKLIQYMACGRPVIGAAVGSNLNVVTSDCGYLASTDRDWEQALATLAGSRDLRAGMGRNGRQRVEAQYNTAAVGSRMAAVLWAAAGGRMASAPPAEH
jgi:glycosyltransferase involved in cell wall biosynthesis